MMWLFVQMWGYLAIAFLLGMLAHRWVFGGGSGLSAEDVSAELASVRTRHQEAEAERARLRSKLAEVSNELDQARREARSAEAEAHAAQLEARAATPPAARAESATPPRTSEPRAPASLPEEEATAFRSVIDPALSDAVSPFLSAAKHGAPDDLTKIRGVGRKLEGVLNDLGVYY